MKIATWNIYWLGDPARERPVRTAADEELVASIVAHMSPDVFAFQEIVNPVVLERILARASVLSRRRYTIRDPSANYYTSDAKPMAAPTGSRQKIFLCVDQDTVHVGRTGSLKAGARRPLAAELTHISSARTFIAVAVHLKSGQPDFYHEKSSQTRRREAERLVKWVEGKAGADNPSFPKPTTEHVVILGDFNMQKDDPRDPAQSLAPLSAGGMAGWRWDSPVPDGPHAHTAIDDRLVIDYMALSPAMAAAVREAPKVYAYDVDPIFGGPAAFHVGGEASMPLRDYRASDHRPVTCLVDY